jgi:hypothetical protein
MNPATPCQRSRGPSRKSRGVIGRPVRWIPTSGFLQLDGLLVVNDYGGNDRGNGGGQVGHGGG